MIFSASQLRALISNWNGAALNQAGPQFKPEAWLCPAVFKHFNSAPGRKFTLKSGRQLTRRMRSEIASASTRKPSSDCAESVFSGELASPDGGVATTHSLTRCFNSQTRSAARSKALVRARVPAAGRSTVFVAPFPFREPFRDPFRVRPLGL